MEFQNLSQLNRMNSDKFSSHLQKKEKETLSKMIEGLSFLTNRDISLFNIKEENLLESIDLFETKLKDFLSNQDFILDKEKMLLFIEGMNAVFWDYFQFLEKSASELFLQMNELGVDQFQEKVAKVVETIELDLEKRLEILNSVYKYLNKKIKFLKSRSSFLSFFYLGLDPSLHSHIKKCLKFLSFNFQNYKKNYQNFELLKIKIKNKTKKLYDYPVLNRLSNDSIKEFNKIYETIISNEINAKFKWIPLKITANLINDLSYSKRVSHLFEEYQNALLNEVFEKSRFFKEKSDKILKSDDLDRALIEELTLSLKEVHLLATMTSKTRYLLLFSNKNPYIRAKNYFPEWISSDEPQVTKNLGSLQDELGETGHYFEQLLQAVKNKNQNKIGLNNTQVFKDLLHQMSNPLLNDSTLKKYLEQLFEKIEQLHELSSFNEGVVDFINFILLEILKNEGVSKFLFNSQKFESIYFIHKNILRNEIEDSVHLNRLNEIRDLGKQISQFLESKSIDAEEVSFFLNDLRGCLQDFLAYVQQLLIEKDKPSKWIKKARFYLLDYRYFFVHYFDQMETTKINRQSFGNKFNFVEEYLEAAEDVLN